ncbi:MAG: hypothetical protein CM15mP122_3400 [Bacteroidota bacterium]|nr:MAG: hypothetical protein CM15mP122_3400 [Bacteroidota bacterium]
MFDAFARLTNPWNAKLEPFELRAERVLSNALALTR